jgi:outer membrane receptor protein involved in Fe transport
MRFIAAALLVTLSAFAQVDTGGVSGVVTDRTGASIPGARVTVTQQATNLTSEFETNEAGFYSAPSLRPGLYNVTISKEGFQPQKSKDFELRVQDRAELNFQLELGMTTAEITISAIAPLLESETSSLGQVVVEKTINELPLNGRNFIQLATLGAGTLPSTRTPERDNFISNGARAVQNSYLLDGVDNKNRIMGFDKSSAQVVQPIIDAIQEFKVQTSTFSAEFGQAAGGVVNVTMKSGTNAFHGNVFEFLRNSYLDATPYFQPAGNAKPQFIQNQFGATFGGPIIRNRTFFFGSWQSSREVNAAPQVGSVPTPAMREGIFSKPVKDPQTKLNFPNNTIPRNRWDLVAAKLVQLYPLPNLGGEVRNFFYNPKERVSGDAYNVRLDHHIGSHDFVFARISQHFGENLLPTVLPEPANQAGYANPSGRSLVLSETHSITPNIVNDFRFGFIYTHVIQQLFGERLYDQFGIKGALNEPSIKGLPNFTVNGLSNVGTANPGNAPIAATGSGNFPSEKSGKIYQILDNVSWVRNTHTVKFGLDLQRVTMFVYATNAAKPGFTFNGTYTGVGLGDFLLGYVFTSSTSQQQLDTIQQRVYQGYIQDDWKATKKLTLNFGLRYELPTPFVEARDRQSNFVTDAGPCFLQLITVADRQRCGVGRSLTRTDFNNFAPRLGVAYQATPKTVVRAGFGMFYGRDEDVGIQRRLPNNPPFISSATFTGDQTNPAFLLRDGLPAGALSLASPNSDVNSFPFNFLTPYVIQWNLNIQREIAGNFVAQLAYTGSEAHKMPQVVNVNQAFPGIGDVNKRRPYQGFSNVQYYAPLVNSNYHALLGKLERRFSAGLSLLASYTYGHSIDDGKNTNDQSDPAAQNTRNLSAERGSSNYDVRHRFVLSGVYEVPFGWSPKLLSPIVRGWQLSGIYSAQTGQPFTVTLNNDPTSTGTTARPDRIRDGALPDDQRSVQRWFDTAAFVTPACPCFGNSGRGILRGPGFSNIDLGIARQFSFFERARLQFRGEAFNLLNHPNLGLPAFGIGAPGVGIIGSVVNPERQIQLAMKVYF